MTTVLGGYFSSHLQELRRRLLVSAMAVVAASALAYFFSDHLVRFFVSPLFSAHPGMGKLVYTNLTEAFVSYLKISLLVGLMGGFPVICYEFWMFISPGLHAHEKRVARLVVLWATTLFAGGIFFAYFVVLPEILRFLLGFANDNLEAFPRLGDYLTFVARTALAFGLAFEIPFLMVMAARFGLAAKKYFSRKRKYFYLAILVLSFLLTVGDFLSAALLALPLFGLYEAGVLLSGIFGKSGGDSSIKAGSV